MTFTVIILVYVDHLMVFDELLHIQEILQTMFVVCFIKETGN